MPGIDVPPIYAPQDFSPIVNSTPKSVLVLGNGFDLSLKMKTSYKDFANNKKYWPFKDTFHFEENSLPYFLNEHKDIDSWFDLEELLAQYASNPTICDSLEGYKVTQAIQDYELLGRKLCEYLQNEEDEYVRRIKENHHAKPGTPGQILLNDLSGKEDISVYTFNYTNANRIVSQFMLNANATFNHVHGSIKDDDIVLGTGDGHVLNDKFFQFHKSANRNYKSCNLVSDLEGADEVYIYGHSLGKNDHDYFKEFFMRAMQGKRRMMAPSRLKIRIYTKDYNSELDICKQLMTLTDRHLVGLRAHCDFKFIRTDEASVYDIMS